MQVVLRSLDRPITRCRWSCDRPIARSPDAGGLAIAGSLDHPMQVVLRSPDRSIARSPDALTGNCLYALGVYPDMTLARAVLIALLAALASSITSAQGERTRITTASSVRLRANPSDRSAIVAILPLGADLVEHVTPARPLTETLDAADRSWVHVRTADGKTGWALAGLTRPTPAGQRFNVVDDLVRRRMIRPDDDFAVRS
jgi:hypothetical protein